MKFGLENRTIKQYHSVFSKYPEIESVIIYGSRAKGNYREGSDIDLTLRGDNITNKLISKVWLDLDELNTPYLIDLSVFHLLEEATLIDHIQRIGKEFYKKDSSKVSI